mgnify:CR=1 FL=1
MNELNYLKGVVKGLELAAELLRGCTGYDYNQVQTIEKEAERIDGLTNSAFGIVPEETNAEN